MGFRDIGTKRAEEAKYTMLRSRIAEQTWRLNETCNRGQKNEGFILMRFSILVEVDGGDAREVQGADEVYVKCLGGWFL
jgi:very-short-patch-repair endonuclease